MPELPEVETVKRGLEDLLKPPTCSIKKVTIGPKKLRRSPDESLLKGLSGQSIQSIRRVAKYLLFELDEHILLSHLGMTGSWRLFKEARDHDHIEIHLEDGRRLTYRDPRRFGMFDILRPSDLKNDTSLSSLGPDPVQGDEFDGDYLFEKSRKCQQKLKTFIMDQRVVVGVGNIYASEALFLAGIHPEKIASEVTLSEYARLAEAIQVVLNDAIFWGGTTISDFKQAGGSEGYFQNQLMVYGKAKEPCQFCETPLVSEVIGGRNSFWCPQCQKL